MPNKEGVATISPWRVLGGGPHLFELRARVSTVQTLGSSSHPGSRRPIVPATGTPQLTEVTMTQFIKGSGLVSSDRWNSGRSLVGRLRRAAGRIADLEEERRVLADEIARLRELATADGLTGLCNYRHFREMLDTAVSSARRHRKPLSVVMIDVDHFKAYNDAFGHQSGDQALIAVADILRATGAEARHRRPLRGRRVHRPPAGGGRAREPGDRRADQVGGRGPPLAPHARDGERRCPDSAPERGRRFRSPGRGRQSPLCVQEGGRNRVTHCQDLVPGHAERAPHRRAVS